MFATPGSSKFPVAVGSTITLVCGAGYVIQGGDPGNEGQVSLEISIGGDTDGDFLSQVVDDVVHGEEITATCVTGTKYTTSILNDVPPTCGECAFIMVNLYSY